MTSRYRLPVFATSLLVLAQVACSVFGGAVPATQPAATVAPGQTSPAATPAAAATPAPNGPAVGADLTYADMQAILAASFAVYPHRIRSSVVITGSSTSTLVIEATDLDHIHMTSNSTMSNGNALQENILISPTLYIKPMTETWRLATPAEQGWADVMIAATDPSKVMTSAPVTETDKLVYSFLDDETVNGVATARYHAVYTDPTGAQTVSDVWIRTGDRRIYQLNANQAGSYTTMAVDYDPSITVVAPIP